MKVFKSLFCYDYLFETDGKFYFSIINLHKAFPDDVFLIGSEFSQVVIDALKGTVYIQTPTKQSRVIQLSEWLESDGLCRTDSHSHFF